MKKGGAKKKAQTTGKRVSAAYKAAIREIAEDRIEEVKVMVVATLDAIRAKENQRRMLDEELKFLRSDIEDLKRGKLDAIKKRHEADKQKAALSKIEPEKIQGFFSVMDAGAGQVLSTTTSGALVNGSATWIDSQWASNTAAIMKGEGNG